MTKYHLLGIAIGCITILDSIALLKGINGVAFSTSLTVIGGIVGYAFKKGGITDGTNPDKRARIESKRGA